MACVLHLTRSAWPVPGGMEASIEGLARAQVARGWRVIVASLRGATEAAHGVERVGLRRVGARRYPFAVGQRPWLEQADVVHVHGLDGLADQVVARHGAVGISTHGGFLHTGRHRGLKRLWLAAWTRRTLARAGAVWFSSASDRALLGGGLDGEVIGDGIEPRVLDRAPVPGRWLVPGRIDVHKGLDDLVDLLRAPALRHRLGELRVVGPEAAPGLVDALRQRAAGLPVVFTGPVDRAAWLRELASAEVAVFPSRHEGFGIAAAEAMAWGVPAVLADIPAFREHLGGAPGVDFRGGDVQGLLQALHDAPGQVPARQQAMARHHWPAVTDRVLDAYGRLRGGA